MSSCKTTVTLTETNNLGGPFRGYSAPQTKSGFKTAEQVISRRVLRDSWNNALVSGTYKGQKATTGSFRLVNNLGDFLGRQNYSCGGPNQISSSKTGTTSTIGSIPQQCDTTGIPPASTNVKFVSDSSDYIKFKKQSALSNNYNDLSNGGDESNASYVNLMRVRR